MKSKSEERKTNRTNLKSSHRSKSISSPLMKQYNSVKAKYPDALLLFRVSDFYESFGNDAIVISKILGINLTTHTSTFQIELTAFHHHALDRNLPLLVRAGFRVAICTPL